MKSLVDMWCQLANELGQIAGARTSRDIATVTARAKHEGLSFLTITLPSFAQGLQKALELEKADPDLWPFFKARGRTPRFLGDLLDLVFDRASGLLLDSPDPYSIYAMRQLTLVFGKIELECSPERTARAADQYIKTEKELRESDKLLDPVKMRAFARISTVLFGDLFSAVDREVYAFDLRPKHGPGATADGLRGNSKFDVREWPVRLERQFPYGDYAMPNWRFSYRLDEVKFLEPGDERPVRVVFVPKTLKTPRVIAIEPTAMQYAQQAVSRSLVDRLESEWFSPMIGFSDQDPNRAMAEEGSHSGALATLDLSEASDRVSNQLVRTMLRHWPHLSGAVDASRSRKADVPGYGVIRLAKFASMGSALTFPIESMVFLTLTLLGIEGARNKPLSKSDIRRLLGRVRVFGDDIIVPTEHAAPVISLLEDFGLLVNRDKSFLNGKFRESCGREYYDGVDVSVVKVRKPLATGLGTGSAAAEVVATVKLRNNLYEAGLWSTARWLDGRLQRILRYYPYVASTSAGLGRVSFLGYDSERECPHHHAPLVKAYVVAPEPPDSPISGEGALLKCLLNEGEPLDRGHLLRTGRPRSVRIKPRWARPF
jgi:hypothetical protein